MVDGSVVVGGPVVGGGGGSSGGGRSGCCGGGGCGGGCCGGGGCAREPGRLGRHTRRDRGERESGSARGRNRELMMCIES